MGPVCFSVNVFKPPPMSNHRSSKYQVVKRKTEITFFHFYPTLRSVVEKLLFKLVWPLFMFFTENKI